MAKLKIGVAGLKDGDLVAKAGTVIDQLTANVATFPTPSPAVAVLTTAKDALVRAMGAAEQRSRSAFNDLRIARKSMKDLIIQEATYVENVANGDEGKIIDGGFEVRKRPVPSPIPGEPDRVTVAVGSYTGTVQLSYRSKDARSYLIFITETDPSLAAAQWTVAGSTTQREFTVEGLASGKAYWFKVSALGTAGESPACEPVMSRAA